MLPTIGMKTLLEKVKRSMKRSDAIGETTAYAKHRTYELTADKSDKLENHLTLFHYGTPILTISYNIFGEENVSVAVYSSSDRDAINALLIVLGMSGHYKFNIHGRNILGGKL